MNETFDALTAANRDRAADSLTAAVIPHDTLWAIEPAAGRRLWDSLKLHSMQQHVTVYAAAQAARQPEDKPAKPFLMDGDTAIFSLTGPMTKSPTSWSSGTSTVRLRRQIDLARQDPDVKSAVIVIDSPGGSVSGTADLAAEIARFAAVKPIVAYVEDCCCSAALWCASQCTRVFGNLTAMVGSQGTVMVLEDSSRAATMAGIEPKVYATGKYKGAGADGTPITAEHDAYFQSIVDDLNSHFVAALRKGRPGITDEQMTAIADAGIYIGAAAVEMGLIDGIGTLSDALSAARAQPRTDPPAKGKEKPIMREKLAAALAACGLTGLAARVLAANTDDPTMLSKIVEEHKAEAVSTPPAATGWAEPSALTPGLTSADIQTAVAKAMAESNAATLSMVADLQKQLAQTGAMRQYDADCTKIDGMVRQMKMTPAEAEGWKAMAKDQPMAFAAASNTFADRAVLAQLRGRRITTDSVAKDSADPSEKMAAMANDMATKTGKPLDECFAEVVKLNPDLAAAYADSMNAVVRGGGN